MNSIMDGNKSDVDPSASRSSSTVPAYPPTATRMTSTTTDSLIERSMDDVKSWRSFNFFSKPTPGLPQDSHEEQSRDYEKTTTTQQDDVRTERTDPPPSSTSLLSMEQEQGARLRMLMASATDAWIQSHTTIPLSPKTTSDHHDDLAAAVTATPMKTKSSKSRKKLQTGVVMDDGHSASHLLDRFQEQVSTKSIPQLEESTLSSAVAPPQNHTSSTDDEYANYRDEVMRVITRQAERTMIYSPHTIGLEPEEILSVEPEHGNYGLKPSDPPSSNTKQEHVSDTSVDPIRGRSPSVDILPIAPTKLEEDNTKIESSSAKPKVAAIDLLRSLPVFSGTRRIDTTRAASSLKKTSTHVSWASSIKPAAGRHHLCDLDRVFIRDDTYVWVPARVLEYQPDYAICALDLPDLWTKMTVVVPQDNKEQNGFVHHPSLNDMSTQHRERYCTIFDVALSDLRLARYSDYENGILPLSVDESEGKSDLANMVDPHLPGILYNLKVRHFQEQPYTRFGDIVFAMNPFAWIPDLYEASALEYYSNKFVWKVEQNANNSSELEKQPTSCERLGVEPHIYEVSAQAYHGVATTGQDQTILVTGESGAGKTETVKILMHHLATVPKSRPGGVPSEHSTAKEILARVLQSIPVLEAFGNAKTSLNANSSRLGKVTKLQFQVEPQSVASMVGREIPYADLVGSICTTYLLEKSRVVNRDHDERSFHIFYQLLSASTEYKRSLWPPLAYRTAHRYAYTAGDIGNIDEDAAAWNDTLAALKVFRYEDDALKTLLQALIIVLQLGNLIFECDSKDPNSDIAVIKNENDLTELAELMSIRRSELLQSLTSRTLRAPGDHGDIRVTMASENAKACCDALAKEVYSRIFDSLVLKVNNYTAYPEPLLDRKVKCAHVFLLDMFGFERFDTNRFEQLCINYANERLHQQYVADNFNGIKDEYETEGIDLNDFKLINNSDTLALLEGNGGIFSALNDECVLPNGTVEAFVSKIKASHRGSRTLINDTFQRKWQFGIDHLTGPVDYDAQNFISRNNDRLPESLIECAAKCSNQLVGDAFRSLLTDRALESAKMLRNKNDSTGMLLQQFQGQLKDLMTTIAGTRTRYIRCLKPNQNMIPRKTDHKTTMKQLECSGFSTILAISRHSFPCKLPYDFIVKRYSCLMPKGAGSASHTSKVKTMLHDTLKELSIGHKTGLSFACGNTMVFLKAGARDLLEKLRRQRLSSAAIIIQASTRRFLVSRRVLGMKRKLSTIHSFCRMVLVRLRVKRERHAATKITSFFRRNQAISVVWKMKEEIAATAAQACAEGYPRKGKFEIKSVTEGTIPASVRPSTAVQACVNGYPKHGTFEIESVAEGTIPASVRRIKDVSSLRADLRALTQQTIMDSKVAGLAKQVGITNAAHSSGKPKKLFSEFMEMYDHLRAEISTLRLGNEELKLKLKSSEAECTNLKMQTETTSAKVVSYELRIQGLVGANDSLVKELQVARQETARLTRNTRTNHTDLEAQLAVAKEELADSKRGHALQTSEFEKEITALQSHHSEVQRRLEQEIIVHTQELQAARQESAKLARSMRTNQTDLEAQLAMAKEELADSKRGHALQISELEKEITELQSRNSETQRRLEQENIVYKQESQAARQESAKLARSMRASIADLEAQLALAKEELVDSKRGHVQHTSELETEITELKSRNSEVQKRLEQEVIGHEQKFNEQKKKMDDEIKLARECYQKQMTSLVDLIDNGHSKQQREVVKVTADLLAMRKEKDEEIMMPQQEIKALKASMKGSRRFVRAALDPRFQQSQIEKNSTQRSRRAADFDYISQNLQALVSEMCVLPRHVSELEMEMVIAQQERGQKMYRLLESLCDLYHREEASQRKTSEEALSLIEEYVRVTEPNRTILNLNDRLMEAELQVCRLEEEIKDKKFCKRCAVRDSTTERRQRISGGAHWE